MITKKNILIISYSYPPNNVAGAQRPYAFAKYLNKEKYKVKVITCKNPDFIMGENKDFSPIIDEVDLIYIKNPIGILSKNIRPSKTESKSKLSLLSKIKSFVFKTGQYLIFPDIGMFWSFNVAAFLKHNKSIVDNTDIVLSTSPGVTNHKIARYMSRKKSNIKWIADFRDFNYVENWNEKTGIKAYMHKKFEESIIKEASILTFVTKTMKEVYQKYYPQYKEKMNCVNNGFDKSDFPILVDRLNDSDKLSFFYAGSFYNGLRSPLPLMELIDKALDEKILIQSDIQITIAGNIDEKTMSEMRKFNSFQCIIFLGNISRAKVLEYMHSTTFLWLIVGNIKSHYQTIPIKLFEYIAARRPIVNFAPCISEPTQIIEDYNLGYNFNTMDFSIEESYLKFKDLIIKFKIGEFNNFLPNKSMDVFSWKNKVAEIEQLLETYA